MIVCCGSQTYVHCIIIAGLLKYFKCKCGNTILLSASLPEPNGSLLKRTLKAIELASAKVTKLKETRHVAEIQSWQVVSRNGSINIMGY